MLSIGNRVLSRQISRLVSMPGCDAGRPGFDNRYRLESKDHSWSNKQKQKHKNKKIKKEKSACEETCSFYVKHKKRLCRMMVVKGKKFCGQHLTADNTPDENGRVRVPCPLDSNHSVYAHMMTQHLNVCNARAPVHLPYYCKDINACDLESESDSSSSELLQESQPANAVTAPFSLAGRNLADLTDDELLQLIHHIKSVEKSHTPLVKQAVLSHPAVVAELEGSPLCGPSFRKHLLQNSSLLAHLQNLGALGFSENSSLGEHICQSNVESKSKQDEENVQSCFLEFGAGRGQLSHWVVTASDASQKLQIVLIDRGAQRYKFDTKMSQVKHVSTKRLRIDIGDLWLEKVPGLHLQGPVYAGGKHLCGAATDLTLRCLDRSVFHVGAESVAQHSSLSNPDDSYEMATCPLHCDSYQEKKSSIDKLSSVSSSSSCQKLFTNELTSRQERRHCAANTHDSSRCESSPSSPDSVLVKACGNSNHRCGSQHREGVDDGTLSSSQKTRSSHETEEAAKCRPSRGLVIALCCHHKCSWQHYVGKKFFKSIGLSGEDFPAVLGLTSWAVCAARPPAGATGDGGAGATGDGGAGATGDGGAGATGDGGAGATCDGGAGVTSDGGAGDSGSSASLATTGGDLDELPAASNMNARKIPKDLERIYSSDAPKVSFDATGLSVLALSEHNTEQTGSTEQAGRSEQTGSTEQAGSSVFEESEALNAQCVSRVQSVNSKRKKSFENVNYKSLKMITHKDSVSDASFGPFVSAGEDSSGHETVTEGTAARNRYVRLGLSISEREEIGRAAKHIIDYGRVEFLRSRGLNATLIQYVDRDVTLENVALIAHSLT
ncbi:Zinc finger CCCH-type TRM13 [Trinorchestia longiramus]|nr:Zinc finger CCCH-type TRM13 [Trinorchestia longiramus]